GIFFSYCYRAHRDLPSFPTRRSSDLSGPSPRIPIPARESRPWSPPWGFSTRSEEHTPELQSRLQLVCRLLPEKKKEGEQQRKQRALIVQPADGRSRRAGC